MIPLLRALGKAYTRGALLVFCLAILMGGCADPSARARRMAQSLGAASWHELRAERFTLVTDGSTDHLEAFARDLARFIAVVDEIVHTPPPNAPARFFLLSSATQPLFLAPHQGGYIATLLPGFLSFVRADQHSPIHRHILLHEFTHYLTLRNNDLSYPHWYVEGIAEFLGSTRTREDTMEVGVAPPHRIAALDLMRARHEEFDIEPILAYERGPGIEEPPLFYESAWALVHYLNTTSGRRKRLAHLLDLQLAGLPWDQAFGRTFSETPAELSEEIDQHTHRIARGAPDAVLFLALDRLNVDTRWTIRKIDRAEADVLLGEASMFLGDDESAEALFLDAIEAAPDDPRALSALSAALAAQGRFDSAEERIAGIDVAAISDAASLCHLGSALYARAESMKSASSGTSTTDRDALYARSLALFERATEHDPRFPVAWAGLGRSRFARGDTSGALEAYGKAAATGERDAELSLDWGLAEKAAGRPESARVRWGAVLRYGSEAQRERAAALIAELPTAEDGARARRSAP